MLVDTLKIRQNCSLPIWYIRPLFRETREAVKAYSYSGLAGSVVLSPTMIASGTAGHVGHEARYGARFTVVMTLPPVTTTG
jgi:hypothetical protein